MLILIMNSVNEIDILYNLMEVWFSEPFVKCNSQYKLARFIPGWPRNNGTVDTVDFSELCSNQQLFLRLVG